jgi:hypothetical protein
MIIKKIFKAIVNNLAATAHAELEGNETLVEKDKKDGTASTGVGKFRS